MSQAAGSKGSEGKVSALAPRSLGGLRHCYLLRRLRASSSFFQNCRFLQSDLPVPVLHPEL
jgi:hypothetical protein